MYEVTDVSKEILIISAYIQFWKHYLTEGLSVISGHFPKLLLVARIPLAHHHFQRSIHTEKIFTIR